MKKLILKTLLFLSPFILFIGLDLFILPEDFFHYRQLETLYVIKMSDKLPGPYYPNRIITRSVEGALGYRTPFAVKETVTWITDRYGYRTKDRDLNHYDIVIVGESDIYAEKTDQENLLSVVLENELHASVYPLAPSSDELKNKFLSLKRFHDNPPKLVILARNERYITSLKDFLNLRPPQNNQYIDLPLINNNLLLQYYLLLDRFHKSNMLNYIKSRSRELTGTRPMYPHVNDELFFDGKSILERIETVDINYVHDIALTLKKYKESLNSLGIEFIFLPIPIKENILFAKLGIPTQPQFLRKLITELNSMGVTTIDTQKIFEESTKQSSAVFHKDDNHWNATGIKVVSRDLIEKIRKGKMLSRF
ncbi:MAG: hypothetical protein HQK52_01625 [Oligoflexia bacterium]|nr:hypothetical protein [Oligoflexia bacterium]